MFPLTIRKTQGKETGNIHVEWYSKTILLVFILVILKMLVDTRVNVKYE